MARQRSSGSCHALPLCSGCLGRGGEARAVFVARLYLCAGWVRDGRLRGLFQWGMIEKLSGFSEFL